MSNSKKIIEEYSLFEAEEAGAFEEDALSEQDALESREGEDENEK